MISLDCTPPIALPDGPHPHGTYLRPELFFDTAATARLLRQKHQNSELSLRARLCPYPLTGWLFRPPGSGLPDLHDEHIANTPSLPRVFGILG
jgi:hypothetical protein